MALSRTAFALQSAANDSGNADFVMSAITTVSASLLVVSIFGQDQGGGGAFAPSMTPSAVGLSFTNRLNISGVAYGYGISIWTAPVTVGAPTVITINPGAKLCATLRVKAVCYTGYDTVTPIGATASGIAAGQDGLQSVTLSGTPATDSEVFAAINEVLNSGAMSLTAGSGWTELDQTFRTDYDCVQSQVRTGSASTTVAWADLDTGAGSVFDAVLAAIEIKAAAGGSSTTVTPAQATITVNGLAPTTSAFQNVRIREVLVNESGQPVGGAANITLLVWYSGRFSGSPDLSLTGMTTDAAGTTSWSIATGTLAYLQPIAYVAQDSISFSNYTCARMIPSYE